MHDVGLGLGVDVIVRGCVEERADSLQGAETPVPPVERPTQSALHLISEQLSWNNMLTQFTLPP